VDRPSVSVIGCGYVGLPLARRLISEGYHVRGSTTSPEKMPSLETAGIEAVILDLADGMSDAHAALLSSDVFVINIPPGRRDPDRRDQYAAWIETLVSKISADAHVIFVSSTSVYPDLSREVFEGDESADAGGSAAALLDAESVVRERVERHSVIRFGGLYGYDRKPGRFFAGRTDIPGGLNPVNMIHLDDAVGVLLWAITEEITGETLNACAPRHPSRADFYATWAARGRLDPPAFLAMESAHKRVSTKRLQTLGYSMVYPDPLMPAP
jgi:nucleoside-diphosphate-sugar epimerase